MGDLLRSPRDRVSYLAYPNLFGTKGFVKVKVKVSCRTLKNTYVALTI